MKQAAIRVGLATVVAIGLLGVTGAVSGASRVGRGPAAER